MTTNAISGFRAETLGPNSRVQGAPEAVLARCSHVMTNAEGGRPVLLSEAARAAVLQRVDDFGRRQALRCLALACRTMPAEHRQV